MAKENVMSKEVWRQAADGTFERGYAAKHRSSVGGRPGEIFFFSKKYKKYNKKIKQQKKQKKNKKTKRQNKKKIKQGYAA